MLSVRSLPQSDGSAISTQPVQVAHPTPRKRVSWVHRWNRPLMEQIAMTSVSGPTVRPELGPCIDSLYASTTAGYPIIGTGGKAKALISHVVMEAGLGRPIRKGYQVLHHCDRRGCIRFEHLYEGTPKDNMHDLIRRHGHPMSKANIAKRARK